MICLACVFESQKSRRRIRALDRRVSHTNGGRKRSGWRSDASQAAALVCGDGRKDGRRLWSRSLARDSGLDLLRLNKRLMNIIGRRFQSEGCGQRPGGCDQRPSRLCGLNWSLRWPQLAEKGTQKCLQLALEFAAVHSEGEKTIKGVEVLANKWKKRIERTRAWPS